MRPRIPPLAIALLAGLGATACVTGRPLHLRSNALEYLYPVGKRDATPPADVKLQVPIRVGLAFAPSSTGWNDPFTEVQKQGLLNRVADAFRDRSFIASIEVIPSTYLSNGGGFAELDRLASAFGIDLMALVSYDQRQFTESTGASWTYLTVVGAFAVRGEKNETRTLMDTVVYDIPSRALLFRSAGESSRKGRSLPVSVARSLRLDSEQSFESATDDLIANLDVALKAFQEQVKSGTVHGAGTPAVEVVRTGGGGGSGGAGAVGLPSLLGIVALAGLFGAGRRARLPWCTLALVAVALVLSFAPGAAAVLQYDRSAVSAGEFGRLLTGQAVHWTPRMAWLDLGAVLLLGAWLERRSRPLFLWGTLAGACATGLGLHLLAPEMAVYRGASGVATALLVLLALLTLRAPAAPRGRAAAMAALALLAAKIVWEGVSHAPLAAGALPANVAVAPLAHLLGGMAGAIVFGIACAGTFMARRGGPRRGRVIPEAVRSAA